MHLKALASAMLLATAPLALTSCAWPVREEPRAQPVVQQPVQQQTVQQQRVQQPRQAPRRPAAVQEGTGQTPDAPSGGPGDSDGPGEPDAPDW